MPDKTLVNAESTAEIQIILPGKEYQSFMFLGLKYESDLNDSTFP